MLKDNISLHNNFTSNMFSTINTLALIFTTTMAIAIATPTMSMPLKLTMSPPTGQVFINGSCLGYSCSPNMTTMATSMNETQTMQHMNETQTTTTEMTPMLHNTSTTSTNTTMPAYNSTCISCMVITSIIKGEIDLVNNTISNITHIIKEICEDFSDPRAKECELVVDSIQRIASLVDKGVNVTQICRDIGLCPNSTIMM